MKKRNFAKVLLASAMGAALTTLLATAVPAFAQSGTKPVRIIVSFAPGGPVDFVARTISDPLSKELGRTVIVENKPGANGAIGAAEIMRSEPDGNTMWITSVGAAAINSSLYEKLSYDMQKDFAPVSLVVNNVELFVTTQTYPAKDAAEFVALAKTKKDPTPIASSGTGSIPHLALLQLQDSSKVDFLHVPYNGMAPALTDLMGGQVAGVFADVPAVMNQVKGGRLKALGIASKQRHPGLPDVKTFEELGIKAVDTNNWYGLFVSSKTPRAAIDAMNAAVKKVLLEPAVNAKLLQSGAEPKSSTPEELASILKLDKDKWATLIKAKNLKADQ
jgi:tripartite-type tricarboxylate transporter receptor subunit TctC